MQQKSNLKYNMQNLKKSFVFYLTNNWWKFLIFGFVLVLDLVTKSILVNQNQELWQNYVLIDGVLVIMPTKNFGAGFSLLYGKTWLLISLTFIFVILFTMYNIFSPKKAKLFAVASALIMTGAVGNLIDRLAFGYVRDFIYLQFINFPVFNVADMALTFGVILLIIYLLFYSTKSQKIQDDNNIGISDSKLNESDNNTEYANTKDNLLQDIKKENITNRDNKKNNNGVKDAKDSDR